MSGQASTIFRPSRRRIIYDIRLFGRNVKLQ
jgi:hypothetical protein